MKELITTRNMNIWKERIEKERHARVASWLKHRNQTQRDLAKEKEEKAVFSTSSIKLPPINAPKTGSEMNVYYLKANYEHVDMKRSKHVSFHITSQISGGNATKGKNGAWDVITSRHNKPEEKLRLPLLPAYVNGQKLGGMTMEPKLPFYGRKAVIKDLFYRKNGVFSTNDRLL